MVENTDYKNTYVYTGLDDYELTFFYDVTSSVVVEWISPDGVLSGAKTEGVDYDIVRVGAVAYVRVLIDFGTDGQITAYREMPYTQTFRGIDGQDPAPSSIETAFDRIVYMVQQIAGRIVGALRLPANENMDMTIPSAVARRGGIAAYADDADAQPIVLDGVTDTPVSTYMAGALLADSSSEFNTDVGSATVTALEELAGTGRTTETVKDNADEIAALALLPLSIATDIVWSTQGTGEELSGVAEPSLAALSSSRVVFMDDGNAILRTFDFDGSSWSEVGSGTAISGAISASITALSSTRIAFFDGSNEDLRTYDFNGSTWSQAGNDLNISGAGAGRLAALSSTRVAWVDNVLTSLRTYDFDGTDWSLVGTAFSVSSGNAAITALTSSRIVYINSIDDDLRVYDFSGSAWSLAVELNVTCGTHLALTAISSSRFIFVDTSSDEIHTYDVIGDTIMEVGTPTAVPSTSSYPALTSMAVDRIAYIDQTNMNLQAYDATGSIRLPSPAFD